MVNYLFKSKRLGFRNWIDSDIAKMTAISADAEVMKNFPAPATQKQTAEFIARMQVQFSERGHCYFATDLLENGNFIGFIGLMYQDYEADFTPCVDIGWRLAVNHWGQGYATEGAKRCMSFAFDELKLDQVVSTAPLINKPSIHVMEKIGMKKIATFIHPRLKDYELLRECALYSIDK